MNGDVASGGPVYDSWVRLSGDRVLRNDVSGAVAGNLVQAQTIGELTIKAAQPRDSILRQLPPAPAQFVNRSHELACLNELLADCHTRSRPAVAVLSGMTGVGKTATGVHWANMHCDKFAGGQLYVDLSAYRHRGAVAVADVLGGFLGALGVHPNYIPAALPERVSMFRTLTAENPVLVFVDDADQAAQVRPLLPGCATGMVLVTSRRRLSGLVMDGAAFVELQPLDHSDGTRLLTTMLPMARVSHEREALRELVGLCAGLPVALRVAGARLVTRRGWSIERLVHYLSDERQRLRRLSAGEEPSVADIFDLAYRNLPGPARHLYRCLGLHPGPDFGLPVVVAVAKASPAKADESLEILVEANLVEDSGQDRYRMHDLVRLHARRRAEQDQKPAMRERTLKHMIEWYLLGAAMADRAVLGDSRWRLARHEPKQWPFEFNPATAMDWFETERVNLLEVVRNAANQRWHEYVWQMCEALWALYYSHKHHADWIETHELAVVAAAQRGNRLVEARMGNQLARAYLEVEEFDRATDELGTALVAAIASGVRQAQAVVYESFGVLHREQGHYADSLNAFHKSRAINLEVADQRGIAMESYHIGDVLNRSGRHDQALVELNEALDTFGQLGDEMAAARARIVLGSTHLALGATSEARAALGLALTTMRSRKQPVKEAQALEILVNVAERDSDADLLRSSATRLFSIYQETGNPRATYVKRWLEQNDTM